MRKRQIFSIDKTINWQMLVTVKGKTVALNIGTSGSHKIYLTLACPSETCSRNKITEYDSPWHGKQTLYPLPNALTDIRINYVVSSCRRIEQSEQYIDECVAAIYKRINGANIDKSGNSALGHHNIWGLLDGGKEGETGQCVPQAFLLEMALRLIGLREAQFRYIGAAASVPVPETGGNDPPIYQSRIHNQHGNEWLFLVFPGSGIVSGMNAGEGTCLCNGKYYPASLPWEGKDNFISGSAVEFLEKLEKAGCKQQWFYLDKNKKLTGCEYQDFPE